MSRSQTIIIVLLSWSSLSLEFARGDDSPEFRHFYFGDCVLPVDPVEHGLGNIWLVSCLKGSAGSQGGGRLGESDDPVLLNHAEGYYGLHLTYAVSFHGRFEFREFRFFDREDEIEVKRYPEYALLRLGNPAINRFRLQLGIMDPAFGFGRTVTPAFFESLEPEFYWNGPSHGFQLNFDNLVNTQLDISVSNNILEIESEDDALAREPFEQLVAARLSYDFAALAGSRMTGSLASNNGDQKRIGLGFVTASPGGDKVGLEFVRISKEDRWNLNLEDQILRFFLEGAYRQGTRWTFQLDDQARRRRMGTLAYDANFWRFFVFSAAVSFEHPYSTGEGAWRLVSGLKTEL